MDGLAEWDGMVSSWHMGQTMIGYCFSSDDWTVTYEECEE
jgi:hypothetical protein